MSTPAFNASSLTPRTAATAVEDSHTVGPQTTMVRIRNLGPNTVFFGAVTGITDVTGYPIVNGESEDVPIVPGTEIFVICSAAETAAVHWLELQ